MLKGWRAIFIWGPIEETEELSKLEWLVLDDISYFTHSKRYSVANSTFLFFITKVVENQERIILVQCVGTNLFSPKML